MAVEPACQAGAAGGAAAAFPARLSGLHVVARIDLDHAECDRGHVAQIQVWDADGQVIGVSVPLLFHPPHAGPLPRYFTTRLDLESIDVPFPGDYSLEVSADDRHLEKSVPFYVLKSDPV